MEAQSLTLGARESAWQRLKEAADRHPAATALIVLGVVVAVMIATKGLHAVAQTGLNGLSTGAIYALGAVGLTLVYGILKLVNFAHGDFLTFGAYMAYLIDVTVGLPLGVGILIGIVATAGLGVAFELAMWRPMRERSARVLQLILMSLG